MDRFGTELARVGLQQYSDDLLREHDFTRQLLLGHLASRGATAEQLAQQEVSAQANALLLKRFTSDVMPTAQIMDDTWGFITKDPLLINTLQSNILWHTEPSGGHHHIEGTPTWLADEPVKCGERPYVVLGRMGTGRKTILVVGCVGADNEKAPYGHRNYTERRQGQIFYLSPSFVSRQRIAQLGRTAASDFPSPDEATLMFTPSRRAYVVTGQSPRSTVAESQRGKNLGPIKRISDLELGHLDVISHLQRIATVLGKVAQLDSLLDRFATPDSGA